MKWIRHVVGRVIENDLLTYASAISFQIVTAIVPVALSILALAGFFNLEEVWRDSIAPRLRGEVGPELFRTIQSTIDEIVSSRRTYWLSLGIVFAIWQISGAVRATMGALNRIHEVEEARPIPSQIGVSLLLSTAVALCLLAALSALELVPPLLALVDWESNALIGVARWGVAVGALYLALLLLVRFAPASRKSLDGRWLTSLIIVASWIAVSAVFRWYVASIADYSSIFGNLASVIVLTTYIYLSVLVFLAGMQLDAVIRAGPAHR